MLSEWRPYKYRAGPVRKLAKPRIGPKMRELQAITSACPGITKAAALRGADLPDRGMGAYRPVHRAIAAGLVIAEQTGRCGPYRLFASEADRRLWHLRDELLHGRPTPERAAELAAEIDEMRHAQAADYAKEPA
jgi:hypothetical protein